MIAANHDGDFGCFRTFAVTQALRVGRSTGNGALLQALNLVVSNTKQRLRARSFRCIIYSCNLDRSKESVARVLLHGRIQKAEFALGEIKHMEIGYPTTDSEAAPEFHADHGSASTRPARGGLKRSSVEVRLPALRSEIRLWYSPRPWGLKRSSVEVLLPASRSELSIVLQGTP